MFKGIFPGECDLHIDPDAMPVVCLNPEKCVIGATEVSYFGHKLTREGIQPDPKKLQAIKDMPPPENKNELETMLGILSLQAPLTWNGELPVQIRTATIRSERTAASAAQARLGVRLGSESRQSLPANEASHNQRTRPHTGILRHDQGATPTGRCIQVWFGSCVDAGRTPNRICFKDTDPNSG